MQRKVVAAGETGLVDDGSVEEELLAEREVGHGGAGVSDGLLGAVAVYASAVMQADPRIASVAVGPCTLVLTLVKPDDGRPAGKLIVQLPKPVRGFVDGFDAARYPRVLRLRADGAATAPPPARPPEATPVPIATP